MRTILLLVLSLMIIGVYATIMLTFEDNSFNCVDYTYETENGKHYINPKCDSYQNKRLPITDYDYWRRHKRRLK